MTVPASNFDACLAFVWRPGHDCPSDLAHTTPGDPGGLTNGGVTQAVWDHALAVGLVHGRLEHASLEQLGDVLEATCWRPLCPQVPPGIDLMLFNGIMLTGAYRRLVQQCVGMMGADVDGWIGPITLGRINHAHPATLIDALSGAHYAYLHGLLGLWPKFGAGWTKRLVAAQAVAHEMALVVPPAPPPPGPPPPDSIRLSS
jgi:lysozyme family protein